MVLSHMSHVMRGHSELVDIIYIDTERKSLTKKSLI